MESIDIEETMDLYQYFKNKPPKGKWILPGVLPCECVDRRRRVVTIEPYKESQFEELSAMYDTFEPKAIAHGLPPEKKEVRQKWLCDVLGSGTNILAHTGGRIAGHSVLSPIPSGGRAEFGIFVHQDFQNQQIGTNLTCVTICCAFKAGFKSLWLCVEPRNVHAIAMYRLFGFAFLDKTNMEICMELDLEDFAQ